jgi:hypothetical protein
MRLAIAAVVLSGCVSVKPTAQYTSSLKLEHTSVAVSVTVEAEGVVTDLARSDVDSLRASLRTSLSRDLAQNGPFAFSSTNADAVLAIQIVSAYGGDQTDGVYSCVMTVMLMPVACLVSPTDRQRSQLTVKARLLDDEGHVLSEHVASATQAASAWIYTGNRTTSFDDLARRVAEDLRTALAADRDDYTPKVLARRAERRRLAAVTAPPGPLAPSSAEKASVGARPDWVAAASADKRLAVLEFRGPVSGDVRNLLADRARAAALRAVGRGGYVVMTRESIAALVKEMGTGGGRCGEGECEVEIARSIGADLVVTGEIVKIGGQYLVTLKLHETARGALLATSDLRDGTELGLVDGIGPTADALFR